MKSRNQVQPTTISKKPSSDSNSSKGSNVKKRIVMTKQSSLVTPKQRGVCINDKLNKNVISCVFGFFSCQDLLQMRLTCKLWDQWILSYIKLQTRFNPYMKKKTDMEDRYERKKLEEEIHFIPNELKEIYAHFDWVTPEDIYEPLQIQVLPVYELLFKLTLQFGLLKVPRHASLIENQDWKVGYVQVFIDKVILPLRISKQYTIRKFLRLFNRVDVESFNASLKQIRSDFVNKIQYIPLVAKKMEIFMKEAIKYYNEYKEQNPKIVEYMEVISDLENNRKEIIIAKNISKKYHKLN